MQYVHIYQFNVILNSEAILTKRFRLFGQNGLAALCIKLVPVVSHFKRAGIDQNWN